MTDSLPTPASNNDDQWKDVRPEDLPPVEPPSAGFIVQLFVVPLLIVAVVIAVYVMFGQLATAEQDWRQLATDVKSENPHVKWRGALGLAQMLDLDAKRGAAGQQLAENRDIATALSTLYGDLIHVGNPNDEETQQIEFLSKALGQLDVDDIVLPVLREGVDVTRDREIRKHSMTGLAMIAGRAFERKRKLIAPGLTEEMIDVSLDDEGLFRHQATFMLGLLDEPAAQDRVTELLDDGDQMVRLNAALGLARQGSLAGLQVFKELFQEAPAWKLDPGAVNTEEQESEYFERILMLSNSLKAVENLKDSIPAGERSELQELLQQLSESTKDVALQATARQTLQSLSVK